MTDRRVWKVGELAERTGISVRGLHHYEEIGLLVPSGRTDSGHRLYAEGDVMRLQQIASLRSLGFSLGEIRDFLDASSFSPLRVIEFHVARLRERMEQERKLCDRLEAVAAHLASTKDSVGDVSTEEFVETVMEVTKMSERIEKYYTPEQREQLERRRQELGEERISAAESEWTVLIEQVRVEMEAGTDPADERVQRLAWRWMELVEEFTGGDSGILNSVNNMWQQEDSLMGMETAPMREMMSYISRASSA
ncbi:MAG: MerR family transcriptional regulator [Rubrobacteraceae bacterium]